jgi:hypothetical protein
MPPTDLSDLDALYRFMRERGIVALEHQGTKLVLGPEPPPSITASQSTVDAATTMTAGRELTDEEILFASSMGWPDEGERVNQ